MKVGQIVAAMTIAAVGIAGGSGSAHAQTVPKAEVSVGYTFLTDGDINFPVGVFGDVSVSVTDSFQVVGEVARHQSTQNESGIDISLNETSFLFGGRAVGRTPSLTGYVQGLVGGATVSGGSGVSGVNVGVSTTVFALQIGGGAIVHLSDRVGLKFSGDYQRLQDDSFGGSNQFKVNAGISFSLGKR